MNMRKGLAALLAAVFFLGVGGVAQAVIGVPDDVPGSTLLYPFFKVNPTRTATDTQDTLLVVTNTAGATTSGANSTLAESAVAPNIAVHFTIWSKASKHVYDFSVILTPHDVFSCSLFDLLVGGTGCANGATKISPAPLGVAPQLQVTVGTQTILAGYVTADLVNNVTGQFPGEPGYPFVYGNILVGHMYLVNLIQGSSTGFNAVSIESALPCYGQNAVADAGAVTANSFGFYRTRCGEEQGAQNCATTAPSVGACTNSINYSDYSERIDGPNGDFAQTGTAGGFQNIPAVSSDSPLGLIVRYFSLSDIDARSELWSWRDRTPSQTGLNVTVYDEDENFHSVTFSVADEVSFSLTADIITPGAPGGWFHVKYLCAQFGSCTYNYATPAAASGGAAAVPPPIQSVAYSVEFADSTPGSNASSTLRWDATFPAHRQYTTYFNITE